MKNYLDIVYDKSRRYNSDYDEKFIDHLIKKFNLIPGKLLDIGCGTQKIMGIFDKKGFEVYGTDITQSEMEKENKQFVVKKSDFENEKLKFDENQFDVVFCKSVVEHLKNPKNILSEAFRVLKPGGKLIILTPSWRHSHWGPFYIDFSHVTPFTEASLRDILLITDFNETNIEIFYQFPLIWKFPFLKFFCKLIALFPIPYFPLHFSEKKYKDEINIVIRFSNEPMLLGHATKK